MKPTWLIRLLVSPAAAAAAAPIVKNIYLANWVKPYLKNLWAAQGRE